MQTVTPGASHLEVTPIAYGTWQFGGDWESVDEQAAVAGLVREGLTRHVGVSNYSTDQITGLLGGTITEATTFGGDDWRSHSPAFTGPGIRRNLEVVAAPGRSAADRGATTAQLAVAWVLAHPAVQVPSSARAPRPISRKASAPSISP